MRHTPSPLYRWLEIFLHILIWSMVLASPLLFMPQNTVTLHWN